METALAVELLPSHPAVGVWLQAETGNVWIRMDDGRIPVLEALDGLEASLERFLNVPAMSWHPAARTDGLPHRSDTDDASPLAMKELVFVRNTKTASAQYIRTSRNDSNRELILRLPAPLPEGAWLSFFANSAQWNILLAKDSPITYSVVGLSASIFGPICMDILAVLPNPGLGTGSPLPEEPPHGLR